LSLAGLASIEFSEVSLRAIVKQDPQEEEENVLRGEPVFQARCGDGFRRWIYKTEGFKAELFRLQVGI
jgi:hypothetical protein